MKRILLLLILCSCTKESYLLTESPVVYKDPDWDEKRVANEITQISSTNFEERINQIELNQKFSFSEELFWKEVNHLPLDQLKGVSSFYDALKWLSSFHSPLCVTSTKNHYLSYIDFHLKLISVNSEKGKIVQHLLDEIFTHATPPCHDQDTDLNQRRENLINILSQNFFNIENSVTPSTLTNYLAKMTIDERANFITQFQTHYYQKGDIEVTYLNENYSPLFPIEYFISFLDKEYNQIEDFDFERVLLSERVIPFTTRLFYVAKKHLNFKLFIKAISRSLEHTKKIEVTDKEFNALLDSLSQAIFENLLKEGDKDPLKKDIQSLYYVFGQKLPNPDLLRPYFISARNLNSRLELNDPEATILPFHSLQWEKCTLEKHLTCLYYERFLNKSPNTLDFCQALVKERKYEQFPLAYYRGGYKSLRVPHFTRRESFECYLVKNEEGPKDFKLMPSGASYRHHFLFIDRQTMRSFLNYNPRLQENALFIGPSEDSFPRREDN